MKKCTTFQCLLKPLTKKLIAEGVKIFDADRYNKEFKVWDHLIAMMYAQIHQIKSLRELEVAFNSQYGIRGLIEMKKLKRSTLSDANARRSAEYFLWIAQHLMSILPRKMRKELGKVVKLLDSSPIQLKGLGYEWAKEHRTLRNQGLKLHVEYDPQIEMPVRIMTSAPNYNDCTMGQNWPITADTIYVFDKGYYDYNWWWEINQKKAFFVTRLKENATVEIIGERKAEGENILEDQMIKFKNKHPRGGKKNLYSEPLRRIVVKIDGDKKPLVFVTNLLELSAGSISKLYKARWGIELFFKWIKQNLKVKKFLGRSENAVRVQLAIAIITYLLIGLFKNSFKKTETLQHTLIWVRHNLNMKKTLWCNKAPPIYHIPKVRFLVNMEGAYL
jgi:putative transposase